MTTRFEKPLWIEFKSNSIILLEEGTELPVSEITSIRIKKGKVNWFVSVLSWIFNLIFDNEGDTYRSNSLLVIKLQNGKLFNKCIGEDQLTNLRKVLNGIKK